MPFFKSHISYIWCGMWLAVTYTTCIFAYLAFNGGTPSVDEAMTMVRPVSTMT